MRFPEERIPEHSNSITSNSRIQTPENTNFRSPVPEDQIPESQVPERKIPDKSNYIISFPENQNP